MFFLPLWKSSPLVNQWSCLLDNLSSIYQLLYLMDLYLYVCLFTCLFNFLSFHPFYNVDWRRQWHPTPVLLPGKSHGRKSLVGCSPWGRKELDTTERLYFHFSLSCFGEGNGNPLQYSCLENRTELQSMGWQRVGQDWGISLSLSSSSTSLASGKCLSGLKHSCESESEAFQLCPTLCDPMDCSLPGFSGHGIFQARVLEHSCSNCKNEKGNCTLQGSCDY